MSEWPSRLAIFDLDYTLTKQGTWGRYVARCMRGRAWRWPELALRAGVTQGLYRLGVVPRIAVKTQMMRVCMVGRPRDELSAIAQDFVRDEMASGLRNGALPAIAAHREAGDRIMIASAAVDLIVEPIAKALNVADWVATRFAWDEDGRLAHHFGSPNCYGTQKKAAVSAFYGGLKPADTFITMYSDSAADIDLLSMADEGVAVNPNRKLRMLAPKMGFEIVDWNQISV